MILLDTNILIEIWRGGNAPLESRVDALDCAIETIVRLEFLQGTNKRRMIEAKEMLERYEFIPFSASISYTAIDLIESYAHLKGLRLADAIIAAACLENNLPLLTLNTKHFKFIPDLDLI
jgi:predicted nucleic acid-binding protein